MPLAFSFSTQRHSFDSETAARTGGAALLDVVMQHAPGLISTEPLPDTPGNTFTPPAADFGAPVVKNSALPVFLPPAPSPNQRPMLAPEPSRPPVLLMANTLTMPPPVPSPLVQAPSTPLLQPPQQPEWAAQIEQLRNDIFSIAMSVSALNDRIDRLDQRAPQAGASLDTLRSEIGTWLENHLGTAVEHCMHRIANRPPTAPLSPAT